MNRKEENEISVRELMREFNRVKNIKFTPESKEEVLNKLIDISMEILKIEPDNQRIMNEIVRCNILLEDYETARKYGTRLLEMDENNVFVLYNMTKLEMKAGNYEAAEKYNEQLLKIDPKNKQAKQQKEIIEKSKQKIERETVRKNNPESFANIAGFDFDELEPMVETKKSIEEEQAEFAKEREENGKYTIENQEKFMKELRMKFIEGKVPAKQLGRIKEELYKYPDKIQSVMLISEIMYIITEREDVAIEELDNMILREPNLTEEQGKSIQNRIKEFKDKIDIKEYLRKKEEEEKEQLKELKKEQREYIREIIKRIDDGSLKKEDIPEIVANLEKYPDRSKSIFLIMELYEGFYSKEEALGFLAKYSQISDLTEKEKEDIVKMRRKIAIDKNKKTTIERRREKVKLRNKVANKKQKMKKKVDRDMIAELVHKGKTVVEIFEETKGEISLKTIQKIKASEEKTDTKLQEKKQKDIELAKRLIKKGFKVEDVYLLIGGNVGRCYLNELKQQMKESKVK